MSNLSVPPTPANQRLAGPSGWSRLIVAVVSALAIAAGFLAPAHADEPIAAIERYVGARGGWGLGKIYDLDVDSQGNLYVLDGWPSQDPDGGKRFGYLRVVVFDSSGKYLRSFGKLGSSAGEFQVSPDGFMLDYENPQNPRSYGNRFVLRVDSLGFVNVLIENDDNTHCWTKFNKSGELIRQQIGPGTGFAWAGYPLHFLRKASVVADEAGGLLVALNPDHQPIVTPLGGFAKDQLVLRLDKDFNLSVALDGRAILSSTNLGGTRGNHLAVGPDGNRFVLQSHATNPKILVFDSDWTMINQFGAAGSGNVEFNNPSQIRVLPNGNLWVWDMGNSRWQEITPSGSFVSESSSGVPPGFDLSGLPENEWTKRLGPSGNEWITTSADRLVYTEWRGTRAFIQGQALDSIGTDFTDTFFRTAYLSRGSVASIRTVDAAGSFINTIGGSALRLLTYNTPSAIDPTPTEFTGIWHWGALRFDVLPNGGLVTVCGTFRPDQAGQSNPDTDAVVRCYAPDGTLAWELEIPDSGDVSIGNVASSAQRGIRVFEGRIWVFVSGVNPRTIVMDTNGSLVGTGPVFPANASTGHYDFPSATYNGAFVSPDGRAFIPVVDAVGVPTGWTGVRDEVAGEWEPRLGRIAVDSLGRTYRIDPRGTEYGSNMLVQRSEWDGTSLTSLGVAGKGRGQFLIPLGVAVGPDDTVYVSDSANHRVQLFTRDRSYIGAFPVPYPGQIEVRGNRIYVLEAASRIGVYIMDPNPPTSTFARSPEANSAGWNTSAVTGTITADDGSNGVGVKEIHYSIDMGTEQTVAGSSATLTIADPGIHTVAFWSVDNNGNIETTRYATVKIDSTKPSTTGAISPVANAAGWNRTAVLFTATGTDNASGVATVALRVNGGAELSTAGTSAATTLSTEGVHGVEHRASDLAGNTGDWVSNTVRIDTTAPSVTVSVVGQTLALTATDALSGVASIHYAIDGGAPKVYTGPVAIALTAKTVSTWAVDVAGNTSATSTKPLRNFLKSISISPGPTAYAGSTVSVQVDLVASPPAGGLVVALASSAPSVLPVPVSVTVPEGALSASFTVDLRGVSTDKDVRLTATLDGAFANANLVVLVPVPKTLTVTPSAIIGGASSTGKVTLVSKAPTGGQLVNLASLNPAVSQVPASVTVPAGATTVSFPITSSPPSSDTAVLLTATADDSPALAVLMVRRIGVTTLTLSPTSVTGGASSIATVSLSRAAPAGGILVPLASSNPVAVVPGSVTVPGGSTRVTFPVSTTAISETELVSIQARLGGVVARANLSVLPPKLSAVLFSPTSVKGGGVVKGRIELTGAAPAGGVVVTLRTTASGVSFPSAVVVPAGATSVEFDVLTSPVPVNTMVVIAAFLNLESKSANLNVTK